jgi:hypothetical protein
VDKVALGQVFLRIHRASHVSITPPMLCDHFDQFYSYQKDKRAKPGNLQKRESSSGYRGVLDSHVHIALFFFYLKRLIFLTMVVELLKYLEVTDRLMKNKRTSYPARPCERIWHRHESNVLNKDNLRADKIDAWHATCTILASRSQKSGVGI